MVDLLESQAGERILDVGCGTGELTFEISNHAAANGNNLIEAVGMDSDLNMVQQAQAQFPRQHFFQGDVRSFTVDEPFDAIFSNAALHWVAAEDSERSVISMAKALKKGGRFVVEFGGKGNVQKIVEATLEVIPEASCPWYFPSISEYTTILERHGIEVLQASLFDRPTPLEDGKEGVKNWLRMFGAAFFEGKANDEIEMALDQIDQKLRDGNSSILTEDGSRWIADYRRIRIVGRKTT